MARTVITPQKPVSGYPTLPLGALAAQLTFQAGVLVGTGMQVVSTGRELIVLQNVDAAPQTVTILSTPDPYNRTGDITAYSLPIGSVTPQFAVIGPFPVTGWRQTDGNIYLSMSSVNLKVAVIQLPAIQ